MKKREILKEKVLVEDSSLVEFFVYDHNLLLLEVKYIRGKHKGKVVNYKNFPRDAFDFITTAESKGKALLSVLKKRKQETSSFFSFFKNFFNYRKKSKY